jgi:hypothetical protein
VVVLLLPLLLGSGGIPMGCGGPVADDLACRIVDIVDIVVVAAVVAAAAAAAAAAAVGVFVVVIGPVTYCDATDLGEVTDDTEEPESYDWLDWLGDRRNPLWGGGGAMPRSRGARRGKGFDEPSGVLPVKRVPDKGCWRNIQSVSPRQWSPNGREKERERDTHTRS